MAYQHALRTVTFTLPGRSFAHALELAKLWNERVRTRKQLKALDVYRLDDIGLTETQAIAEARKYFWQP